jgi:plasmid stabilization system protein ParE
LEKEIIWTDLAKQDIRQAYEFNIELMGEEKAFRLIEHLVQRTEVLYNPLSGGTRYISQRTPEINYQKLVEGHFAIVYRQEGHLVYINRVFDTRQNPSKLDL